MLFMRTIVKVMGSFYFIFALLPSFGLGFVRLSELCAACALPLSCGWQAHIMDPKVSVRPEVNWRLYGGQEHHKKFLLL